MVNGRTATIALFVGLGLGMSQAAVAQQAGTEPATNQGTKVAHVAQSDTLEITTDLLERVAAVYPIVVALAEEAEPRIAGAETEPVAEAIREQLEDRIAFYISTVKLSLDQYLAVVRRLNVDEDLREEFRILLERGEVAAGA